MQNCSCLKWVEIQRQSRNTAVLSKLRPSEAKFGCLKQNAAIRSKTQPSEAKCSPQPYKTKFCCLKQNAVSISLAHSCILVQCVESENSRARVLWGKSSPLMKNRSRFFLAVLRARTWMYLADLGLNQKRISRSSLPYPFRRNLQSSITVP